MRRIYIVLFTALTSLAISSCSETLFDGFASDDDGAKVELSLPIYVSLPQEVMVTRSGRTEAEEKRLNDLQILIFNASTGKLKGFKHLAQGNSGLNSKTYADGEGNYSPQEVTGILTRTGNSYIYAVANCKTTDYNITVPSSLNSYIQNGVFTFNESTAQDEGYDFYFSDLQKLGFSRESGEISVNDGYFLMCGMIEESAGVAKAVNIKRKTTTSWWQTTTTGYIDNVDTDVIKLRRVVAKVKFDVDSVYSSGNNKYTFNLQSYDIYNIPTRGNLVQGETASETADYASNVFERMTNLKKDQQTSSYNGFIVYLPENMQTAKNQVTDIHQREANETDLDANGHHVFNNAPDGGTYVVLHGTYEETENGTLKKSGATSYMVHLGNFSADPNDYNNERNYYYTYTVHVRGIDKIITESKREGDYNPGAEGFTYEYGNGRSYKLDSHYDYCVMRFYQDEIKTLINNGTGYSFYVNAMKTDRSGIGETSRKVVVTSDGISEGSINGVDTDWIRFLKGGSYDKSASHGGADPGYKSLCDANGYTDTSKTNVGLSIVELLQTLYNNADNNSFWNQGYIDYVCYVDENFYTGMTWDKFTNCKERSFYIADEVDESSDGRSVYATRAYDVYQKSIQTFYNSKMSSSLTAYGCETYDETANMYVYDNPTANTYNIRTTWNGRNNMIADNGWNANNSTNMGNWIDNPSTMRETCMKRNRDLNHDGKISSDEIRWYIPSVHQYTGLWIGQSALDSEADLYYGKSTKTPDIAHYYTSTTSARIFWAEEGMAFGNWTGGSSDNPKLMKCIRNLPQDIKNNNSGADDVPDEYYTCENNVIDMEQIDPSATQTQADELGYHTESDDGNKVAIKFQVASSDISVVGTNIAVQIYQDNSSIACKNYSGYDSSWRIPNQRELCMMYVADISLNNNTFCRTHYSGMNYANYSNYRHSWQANGGIIEMGGDANTNTYIPKLSSGYIRCIKVNP